MALAGQSLTHFKQRVHLSSLMNGISVEFDHSKIQMMVSKTIEIPNIHQNYNNGSTTSIF